MLIDKLKSMKEGTLVPVLPRNAGVKWQDGYTAGVKAAHDAIPWNEIINHIIAADGMESSLRIAKRALKVLAPDHVFIRHMEEGLAAYQKAKENKNDYSS